MKIYKTATTLAIALLLSIASFAEELPSKTQINWSIDLVSRHLWRGNNSGTAPTIEPTLELQTGKFTFGAWGAYAWDKSYQEVDLYIQYNTPLFQFAAYDFYCPNSDYTDSQFMDFSGDKSVHLFDLTAKWKGSQQLPISMMASVLPYGSFDKDANGNQNYSTYLEFGYSRLISQKKVSWTLGLTPFEGMYADGLNVVNMNMTVYDEIKITDSFFLPVRGGLTLNPYKERLFFTFAITLK